MPDRQIFAFWRIALNQHPGGASIVFGGSVHTYEACITARSGEYLGKRVADTVPAQWITLDLSKRERNNW